VDTASSHDDVDRSRVRSPAAYAAILLCIYASMHLAAGAIIHALTPSDARAATTAQRGITPATAAATASASPTSTTGTGSEAAGPPSAAIENWRECERDAGIETACTFN
jgi:hypothetical protein